MNENEQIITIIFIPLGKGIEKNYNEANWENYADNGVEEWKNCDFKEDLLHFVHNDLGLAVVLYHWFGRDYKKWMIGIIPALNGYTGIECLDSDPGIKRLKQVLMCMR